MSIHLKKKKRVDAHHRLLVVSAFGGERVRLYFFQNCSCSGSSWGHVVTGPGEGIQRERTHLSERSLSDQHCLLVKPQLQVGPESHYEEIERCNSAGPGG